MKVKELSRETLVYAIVGAALLVFVIFTVYLLTANNIKIDANRYDLSNEYAKQQYDLLVKAEDTLKTGFSFDAATQRAAALFALQDYKQSEKAWKYFIQNRPRAIQGYWGLAEIYEIWKRYPDAEKNWLMAIEVDTPANYPNSYIKIADLYRDFLPEKRYKLVQILTNAIAKNPTEANYPLLLATYYRDTGDYAEAIRFYTKVLELDPNATSAPSIRNEINELKAKSQ